MDGPSNGTRHSVKEGVLGLPTSLTSIRFMSSSSTIGSAIVLSGIMAYAFQVIMGRFLGVALYGEFAALFGLLAFLLYLTGAVTTIEARSVVNASESPTNLASLLRFFYRRMVILGAVCAIAFAVLSGPIANWLHVRDVSLVWFVAIGVFGSFLLAVAQGALQGLEKFRLLSLNFLLNSGVRLAAGLGLVLLGLSLWGAMAGAVLGILAAGVVGTLHVRPLMGRNESSETSPISRVYAVPTIIATLFSSIPTSIDVVAIQHLLPGEDAGLFAASAVFGRITYFIPAGIVIVLFPMLVSQNHRAISTSLLLRKALLLALSVASLIGFGIVVVGNLVVRTLFGEAYLGTTTILPLYEAMMVVFSGAMVLVYYHLALGKPAPIYWATGAIVGGIGGLWVAPRTLSYFVEILLAVHLLAFGILSAYALRSTREPLTIRADDSAESFERGKGL